MRFDAVLPGFAGGGARRLTLAWLALACAALGAAALCAAALVAARSPVLAELVPHEAVFRPALVQHVVLSTIVWLLACAGALASAAATRRHQTTRWGLFGAAAIGTLLTVAAPAAGGEALLVDYVPIVNNALYKTGLALFACGVGASALLTAAEGGGPGGAAAGTPRALRLWCVLPLLAAAVSLAWSAAELRVDLPARAYYGALFWGPGHALQFAHVAGMLLAWLALARVAGVAGAVSHGLLHAVLALSAAPVLAIPLLHALHAPGTPQFAAAFTELMRYGGALVALPAGAGLLIALWRRRAAPSLAAALLAASIALFIAGCALGAVIRAQDMLVPAHYHGTVGAATLAYMGVIAHLIGGLRDARDGARAMRWAALHAAGLAVLVIGLAACGAAGVPRKLAWLDAAGGARSVAMAVILAGGAAAIVGAAAFCTAALRTLARAAAAQRAGRPRTRDVRGAALAATVAAVALGGTLLAGAVAGNGAAGARADASGRTDPAGHAAERRRAEVAARFEQAVVMLHAREYAHAVTALHRVLELSPQMPEAHVDMGYALLGLRRPAAARDFFESALALRPGQVNAYYGLAMAVEELGDRAGAVGAMRAYVHLSRGEDPFLRKAYAALWEWEAALAARPSLASVGAR